MDAMIMQGRKSIVKYSDDWKYVTDSTSSYVMRYIGSNTNVTVPNKIDNKPTTLQCTYAYSNPDRRYSGVFINNTNITNVVFSNKVNIENDNMYSMFEDCINLGKVSNLPNSITNMSSTFWNCWNLSQAPVIPNNVTDMDSTFMACNSLTQAPIIPNSVSNMHGTFYTCTNLTNALVVIPNSVTSMPFTFAFCTNLTNAPIILNSTNMYSTFKDCHNLTNAPIIPSSVTYMYSTFDDCPNLTGNIIMESENISTFESCFNNTSATKIVYIPFTYENGVNTKTYNSAFNTTTGINGKNGVTVYDINEKFKNDFGYRTNDTATLITSYHGYDRNVVVPNRLNGKPVVVVSNIFAEQSRTVFVKFNDKVSFENSNMLNTFYYCDTIKYVVGIPNTVTTMDSTFHLCKNLTQAPVIPNSVTDMHSTFSGCYNLTQAPVIPNSVTTMYSTFSSCHNLTQAPEIPDSVTDMGRTFYNCYNLTQAPEIPNSVTNMSFTFSNCSITQAPEIPNSVTNMSFTFMGCGSLTGNIIIQSSNISNFANCFSGTTKTKTVYIPFTYENGVNTKTYNSAFNTTTGINGKNGVTVYDIKIL